MDPLDYSMIKPNERDSTPESHTPSSSSPTSSSGRTPSSPISIQPSATSENISSPLHKKVRNTSTSLPSEGTSATEISPPSSSSADEGSWVSRWIQKIGTATASAASTTGNHLSEIASTTSNHISAATSTVSSGIKSVLFAPETLESLGQINDLIDTFFKDVPFNKVDMMLGLGLLNTYYKNMAVRSGVPVDSREFLIEAERYMRFASATYGWKCVYGFGMNEAAGTFSMLGAAVSMGDSANLKVLCEHTGLTQEDVLVTNWTSSNFHPGHYIAMDHARGAVVLAVRGTFHARDALVDLVAQSHPYLDGHVHAGMFKCAENKLDKLAGTLVTALARHPGYRLVVVGHSLGAGVASLFTLLFNAAFPQVPIHCYAYAPPCAFSMELALSPTARELITSFVLHDDIVPRLCFGTLSHLKDATVHILSQSSGTMQRTFQWMSAPGSLMPDAVKAKIASSLKWNPDVNVKYVTNTHSDKAMYPPGKVYHMCRINQQMVDNSSSLTEMGSSSTVPSGKEKTETPGVDANPAVYGASEPLISVALHSDPVSPTLGTPSSSTPDPPELYILEESNPSLFNEIIVSSTMLSDHMPHTYEIALQGCLQSLGRWTSSITSTASVTPPVPPTSDPVPPAVIEANISPSMPSPSALPAAPSSPSEAAPMSPGSPVAASPSLMSPYVSPAMAMMAADMVPPLTPSHHKME
eukprot:TRINITY_DN2233_c0_g1_i2.p1 TRINITY_DN2233_c0_g1~~TRINITY_DN2233_c0_g1_i2.p1  ORF type:complete len:697 (-),score=160.26 TRINITY_DN2233_c0_g1_i2:176-2266(-)